MFASCRNPLVAAALATTLPLLAESPAMAAPKISAERPLIQVKGDLLTGKIVATLPKPDAEGISGRFIYLTQLENGLGSAPLGLDRAAPSGSRILIFPRRRRH